MTRSIGTGPAGGGGGGGGGITEIIGVGVNITNPTGPTTTITATAATVGADPSGTAAGLVSAHEIASPAHDVAQITDALDRTGDTMTGTLAMGAEDITGTGAVTATTFNGVPLTTGGGGGLYLDDQGAYTTTGPSALMPMQYSDTGNRGPGAALRSGGDMFGNLTPGSAQGQPTTGGTIRRVSWRRTTTPAGFVRVSIINAGGGTERTFFLVTTGAGVGDGETSGLSVVVNDGEQIAVLWDSTSSGTTQNLAVTVYVEPAL